MEEDERAERSPQEEVGESWQSVAAKASRGAAGVAVMTARLGTSLMRHLAASLDSFLGDLSGDRKANGPGRR